MQSVDRLAIFERLKYSIQLLACPAEIQLNMLPRFVCKADELALDFDLWCEVVLHNFQSDLSADQISSLENVGRNLSELTHMGAEHWTEQAVRDSMRLRTAQANDTDPAPTRRSGNGDDGV